jgi:hypothetical protein
MRDPFEPSKVFMRRSGVQIPEPDPIRRWRI